MISVAILERGPWNPIQFIKAEADVFAHGPKSDAGRNPTLIIAMKSFSLNKRSQEHFTNDGTESTVNYRMCKT